MRSIVIGCGHAAAAVGLSLLAQQASVSLSVRDATQLQELRIAVQKGSPTRPWPAAAFRTASMMIPQFQGDPKPLAFIDKTEVTALLSEDVGGLGCAARCVCLCVPSTELRDACGVLREAQSALVSGGVPIIIFSRGLCDSDGRTPAAIVAEELPGSQIIVASGGFVARLWAEESRAVQTSAEESEAGPGESVSSVPLLFAPDTRTTIKSRDTVAKLFARELPRWTAGDSDDCADRGSSSKSASDAELWSLLNACSCAVAFGAGMATSASRGDLHVLSSYFHHALSATERLVRDVVLPPNSAWTAPADLGALLFSAVSNSSSMEYSYGRKQDFYFTQRAAMDAMYPGGSTAKEQLETTFAGLYTLISKKANRKHPFYRALVEGFEAMHRPQRWAQHVVKEGNYAWLDRDAPRTPLLEAVQGVDAAITNDGRGYDKAWSKVSEVLGASSAPPHRNFPEAVGTAPHQAKK